MELPSFQTFEWYESAMVFRVLFFIFLFETTGKKQLESERFSSRL